MQTPNNKMTHFPLPKLVPSIVTITALCLGLISIRYSIDGKFTVATTLIVIAAILDGLDGRIARYLNAASEFGAHLDSLSDLINFGLAPALLMYLWSMYEIPYKGIGWAVILLFVCCAAIRLARFNTLIDRPQQDERLKNYIIGLPMPAAAALLLLPIMLSFELIEGIHISAYIMAVYMAIISIMMISNIPIYSGKMINIEQRYASIFIIGFGLLLGSAILEPWVILPVMLILYIISIPIGIYFYHKGEKHNEG